MTPKTLMLVRHAKSDWSEPDQEDFDRPLNARGRRAAPSAAEWIVGQGLVPDQILCSDAVRTRETCDLFLRHGMAHVPVAYERDLYLASPETILHVIQQHGGHSQRLLVLAHNPGLEQLANHWSHQARPFPTAAIAVLQGDLATWSGLSRNSGMCVERIWTPKDGD